MGEHKRMIIWITSWKSWFAQAFWFFALYNYTLSHRRVYVIFIYSRYLQIQSAYYWYLLRTVWKFWNSGQSFNRNILTPHRVKSEMSAQLQIAMTRYYKLHTRYYVTTYVATYSSLQISWHDHDMSLKLTFGIPSDE